MTAALLDDTYASQLDGMVKARTEHENLRHLALMARETRRRRGAELQMPNNRSKLWIWADLHFDDSRIRTNRPFETNREMNEAIQDAWRLCVAPHDTIVCAGDLGGRRSVLGRWTPPCRGLPGRKFAVLGNHDFTRFRKRERRLGVDFSVMTIVINTDPALLVTHVPLDRVPDACVNVHGHHHDFKPLKNGPWINVSLEHTNYWPLDVRTEILPLARVLAAGRVPEGSTTMERIARLTSSATKRT